MYLYKILHKIQDQSYLRTKFASGVFREIKTRANQKNYQSKTNIFNK